MPSNNTAFQSLSPTHYVPVVPEGQHRTGILLPFSLERVIISSPERCISCPVMLRPESSTGFRSTSRDPHLIRLQAFKLHPSDQDLSLRLKNLQMLMADPLTSERLAYWTYQRAGSFHDSMIGQVKQEDQERFPCSKCHRSYRNKNHLSRHIRYECDRKKQYKCEYCFKDFYRRDNLKTHVNLKHPAHAIFPDGSQKGGTTPQSNSVSPDSPKMPLPLPLALPLALDDVTTHADNGDTKALALVTPKRAPINSNKAATPETKNRENSKPFPLKHPDSIIALKLENPLSQESNF